MRIPTARSARSPYWSESQFISFASLEVTAYRTFFTTYRHRIYKEKVS